MGRIEFLRGRVTFKNFIYPSFLKGDITREKLPGNVLDIFGASLPWKNRVGYPALLRISFWEGKVGNERDPEKNRRLLVLNFKDLRRNVLDIFGASLPYNNTHL